jgi:gliding motility-associated lipoprotein GldH
MKKILLLLSLFMLLSCAKTVVIKQNNQDFPDNQWAATDIKKFEFKLKRDIEVGDIKLLFSHVFEPQYSTVPMAITIEKPSGEKENVFLNVPLKDDEGNDLSECSGDICDLHAMIKEGVKLEKGNYKISIENKFAYAYLANVLGVGISVERED